jgi:GntR family transcriptional repressor for pyruvate dehydrogenase complex
MTDVMMVQKKRIVRFRKVGRKEGLADVVVRAIQEQIFDGRLVIGSLLPSQEELAERLGVSRPVVREAIRSLVAKGMLDSRQGVGTVVRAVTHEQITAPLSLFLRTCGQEVNLEHLHEVRSILEVGNASLAAEHRSEADVEDLVRIRNEMKAAADNAEVFAELDSEFHIRVSQATQNPLLTLLLGSIQKMMAEVRVLVSRQPDLFDRVMPTHISLLNCIMTQDSAGARAAMREHLQIALEIQKELLDTKAT